MLNRREICARRGLIVSGLPATGKSTALKQLGRMRAFRDAQHICIGWRPDGLRDPGFGRRIEIFRGL